MMRTRNPIKKLLRKIESSHETAPHRVTLDEDGNYDKDRFKERKEKANDNPVLITEKDIVYQYEKQDGYEYWFSTIGIYIPLNLMDVFNPEGWYPWSPSVDKLNPELGYVPGNFCLTFAFLNFGRNRYAGSMKEVMRKLVEMSKNEKPIPHSTLIEFLK